MIVKTGERLRYRDARQEDLAKIVEIYNSTIPSGMVTADIEPVAVDSRQKWFDEHHPDQRPLWIVEQADREIVGWVSFQSFYGRPAYQATVELSIYLDARYRGRGLGRAILAYCIDRAPTFGVKTLLAFIFSHNEPSLKLFSSLGFDDWATLPNVALVYGQERGLKILGKRIA
ncbi:N-acetyltransferase family protein [Parapedobacter sp. DT-150]|uniref:GNAT family N-acetyltransferase n=1 Tax=Parapedobacter sp. DT-150 TaxID=3396162 RepID=UPI003F1A062B